MPVTVGVTIYNTAQEPVSKFDATFADDEWDTLVRFARYEAELAKTVFVQDGMPHEVSFVWSATTEFSPPPLPPESQMSEFLHRLRPFLVESEPTYYNKVQGIVTRALPHEGIRQRIGFLNDFFTCRLATSMFRIDVAGLTINSATTLSLWLNAFEYHRDAAKQQRLEAATAVLPFPIAKAFFVDLLVMQAEAIQGLAAIIRDLEAAAARRRGWVG